MGCAHRFCVVNIFGGHSPPLLKYYVMGRKSLKNKIKKVDFVIAGTQKGGTSALDAYLREHPEICMANVKECHFFDNERYFQEKDIDYSTYHSFFTPEPQHKLLGEATPIYMYWHDAPKRMWMYNPAMKIIVILRNPIERAYSNWNMELSRSNDTLSFWDAIRAEGERCREALPYQHRIYSYIDRGFYVEQLRRIWNCFPKNQTLVIRNEDLRNNTDKTLYEVFRFLDVGCLPKIDKKDVHSIPCLATMTDNEKEYLRYVFEYEIRNLERILGWDCNNWLAD